MTAPRIKVELFVPGRVCLLGEHTDWASQYEGNPHGHCLVYGTDLGLYATAEFASRNSHADELTESTSAEEKSKRVMNSHFLVRTTCYRPGGGSAVGRKDDQKELSVEWNYEALLNVAREGGFFSYIGGCVAYMMKHPLHGNTISAAGPIILDNYRTTLPMGKGLSSSAAICVMVVEAFNKLHNLEMDVNAVMDAAYEGENLTPSRCGRMDQCVAFGRCCVSMNFDHRVMTCSKVEKKSGKELYFVVADLNAGKDTKIILADLRRAFESLSSCDDDATETEDELQKSIRTAGRGFLGNTSLRYSSLAQEAVQETDGAKLGQIMTEVQAEFRKALQPLCPSQLTSPKLYRILEHPEVQKLSFGGKGVGSQGDGTIQLVARSKEDQTRLCTLLSTSEFDCTPYAMTL